MNPYICIPQAPAETPGASPSRLDSRTQAAGERTQIETTRGADTEAVAPAIEAASPTPGQLVFHSVFGYGEVAAIDGDVTFCEKTDKTVSHTVKASDLLTKDSAAHNLATSYYAGGAREWRRRQGQWASITKNLCRWGEWEPILKKYNLNRGSMDVLIARFEEEEEWKAQSSNLLNFSKLDLTEPDPHAPHRVDPSEPAAPHSNYSVTGVPQVNERTPDPENDAREKNKLVETAKRQGVTPTPHRTMLHLQRRDLDPQMLARYYAVREKNKDRAKEITDRKIDEAIIEVLALAADTVPQLGAPVVPAGGQSVNDIVDEVCSALRNLGFSEAEINSVELDPNLAFNEMMLAGLKQLKPNTEE